MIFNPVRNLADALSSESLGHSRQINLYLHSDKCPFLKNHGILVDTPGIDLEKELDLYIKECCQSADVFVLAVNSDIGLRDTVGT